MKIIYNRNIHNDKQKSSKVSISNAKELELLYNESAVKLFQIAFNRVKSREVAEGIVHNVFCDIWERRDTLIIKVPLEAYVVKAVKLAALDHIRERIRKRNIETEIQNNVHIDQNKIEEQIYARERKREIDRLVDFLPPRCKEIFLLNKEKDKSKKEIAVLLGISEKTVENQIYRAVKYLKANI